MKRTAGKLEDGIRIQNGITNVEMWCVRSWKLFRGSKLDMYSRIFCCTKKWMENGWLGK